MIFNCSIKYNYLFVVAVLLNDTDQDLRVLRGIKDLKVKVHHKIHEAYFIVSEIVSFYGLVNYVLFYLRIK